MTVPGTLKRLAEIKDEILALYGSDLPKRVKRARERHLRHEADRIALKEAPSVPGMCTRCQEAPFLQGSNLCHQCVVHYLDLMPRWAIAGVYPEAWVLETQAQLIKTLLDNKLIGTEDGDGKDEFRPVAD